MDADLIRTDRKSILVDVDPDGRFEGPDLDDLVAVHRMMACSKGQTKKTHSAPRGANTPAQKEGKNHD